MRKDEENDTENVRRKEKSGYGQGNGGGGISDEGKGGGDGAATGGGELGTMDGRREIEEPVRRGKMTRRNERPPAPWGAPL